MAGPPLWDIFCRVIDNFGDAGVCWRLAADLASRGQRVRLWIDDPAPLAWMAPRGADGVEVVLWAEPLPACDPGDIVIEAFGCDPPPAFVDRMAVRAQPPVWINLEHLSAEAWVERSHALPSPQRNGLTKWFFFPGFTSGTGGLIREQSLLADRAAFDREGWLRAQGIDRREGERVVSLFCYRTPALAAFLDALGSQPTLVLLTPGFAQQQVHGLPRPARVRTHDLPWLDQPGFDRLLWSADLNVVRGEDSVVRALWAGAPFVWHIYPQHDFAHVNKLQALLDAMGEGGPPALSDALQALWRRFNGLGEGPVRLPDEPAWSALTARFRARLGAQTDLVTRLQRFVAGKG